MPRHLAHHPRQVLEKIIDTALDAFVVTDTNSVVLAWTRQATHLLGWTQEEAHGRNIAELIIPAHLRQAHAEGMRRYLAGGEAHVLGRRVQIEAQHKDGHVFPVELSITVAEVEGRRIFSAALRDITEVRRANERAERLTAVMESTTDFVGFADPSGAALYINRAGRALVGIAADEPLEGRSIRDKYPAWAFEVVQRGIAHARVHGVWSGESALITATGAEIATSQVITAHKDSAGRLEFISTIIRDMSHRHEVEKALRVLDRRKDEFLAMLAHELRNPLAPIATAAHILSRDASNVQRVERTSAIIERQVRHMTKLLDDLLDVSRVTRGLIQLQRAPVDLIGVAHDALEQAMPLIEGKRHHVRQVGAAEPLVVDGDRTRLVQAVANLLTNAARYTPPGGDIALELRADGAQAVVEVRDNGVGIPSAMQEQIFEIFTQVERSNDRAEGGLGLGLALVKSIVELHGGSVAVHSSGEAMGSSFVLRFPRGLELSPAK